MNNDSSNIIVVLKSSDVVCIIIIRRCKIPPAYSCKPEMAGTGEASVGRELVWRNSCQNYIQAPGEPLSLDVPVRISD